MLLTADVIAQKIELALTGSRDGISVVPTPDLAVIRQKGGASIDLRLGRWFLAVRQSKVPLIDIDDEQSDVDDEHGDDAPSATESRPRQNVTASQKRYFIRFDDKFILHPNRFILGITLEWIALPSRIAGYVTGKSSWGRRGLIIETAAGIHPGFSGCLALELANVGELPIALRPGMPICQIFLYETTEGRMASSSFDGRRRPVLGAINKDAVFSSLSATRKRRMP